MELTSVFKAYNSIRPPYGSSVAFELRKKNDKHYITVKCNLNVPKTNLITRAESNIINVIHSFADSIREFN